MIEQSTAEMIKRGQRSMLGNYRPLPVVISHGKGSYLYDKDGKRYLDFLGGIAVCNLGYAHPELTEAVREQAANVMHTSNVFWNQPAIDLAEKLTRNSFAERVFFANSGAEANEAMIKLARRYFFEKEEGRYEIIAMHKSFHGRTIATVSVTGQEKYQRGFAPLLPGVKHVDFGNIAALEAAFSERTAAVLLEPIQGEGGIQIPPKEYLKKVRELCNQQGCLMLLDEVQSGMGRTGTLFAYEQEGFEPDIMSLAKGLGGGMPIGAMLTTESIGRAMPYGSHGSTFGGNPVACAAGNVMIDTVSQTYFLKNVRLLGEKVLGGFKNLARKYPELCVEARGRGLWCGLELKVDGSKLSREALKKGLILNVIGGKVIRAAPPLTISSKEIDEALEVIDDLLSEMSYD